MNWLDWLIIVILAGGLVNGFREGLVRLVVGFGAMLVAFLAASWLNGLVAGYLSPWIANRTLAVLAAYVLIFSGVMLLGGIIASLIVRVFKLIGLSLIDRVLGAVFGAARAMVILVIITMVVMAFTPGRIPGAVRDSTMAPYVIGASRVISGLAPFEIRSGVEKAYNSLREQIEHLRSMKHLPTREE